MKIWALFYCPNEHNSQSELTAFWGEFPQLGHVSKVIQPGELTCSQIIGLLDHHQITLFNNDSWSLIEIEEGQRI
jgi:hypothetical protein